MFKGEMEYLDHVGIETFLPHLCLLVLEGTGDLYLLLETQENRDGIGRELRFGAKES